jgi:hypothetical protein
VGEAGGVAVGRGPVLAEFHDGEVVMVAEREEDHWYWVGDAAGNGDPQCLAVEVFGALRVGHLDDDVTEFLDPHHGLTGCRPSSARSPSAGGALGSMGTSGRNAPWAR